MPALGPPMNAGGWANQSRPGGRYRAMTGWGRLNVYLLIAVLCFTTGAGLLFCYFDQAAFLEGERSRGQIPGRDFAVFWAASRLALAGRLIEIFDWTLFHQALGEFFGGEPAFSPFPYPPHGLLVVLPLALAPYYWSLGVWISVQLAAFSIVCAPGRRSIARVLVLLIAPATLVTINFGQNGLLTAVLFLAGMALLDRRPVLAGLCFALLAFKPQLGLLIPVALLAGRHWAALAAAAGATAALLATSLWLAGAEAWHAYLTTGIGAQTAFMEQGPGMFTLMVPSAFMAARLLDLGLAVGYGAQGLSALGAAAGVAWAFRVGRDRRLQLAVLIAGTFLVSPYIFNYDMPLLAVAVLCLADRGFRDGFLLGERVVLIAAWALPLAVMVLNAAGWPAGPVVLAALFAVGLRRIRRSAAADDPAKLTNFECAPA